MFRDFVVEMSRRRFLLIWATCLTLVILMYLYLPYSSGASWRSPQKKTIGLESPMIKDTFQGGRRVQEEEIHTTSTEYFVETTPTPTTVQTTRLKICVPDKESLVGAVYVNKTAPYMQEVIEELSVDYGGFVEKGGAYRPKDCIPNDKLAIIVPYRNRSDHLKIFLRQLHPIMERQRHDYRIIVVEQAGNYSFNRAMLLNVGFLEALKIANFDCLVFHDVDHILENDKNYYGCPESPKLLGVSVERQQYRRRQAMYLQYFGGVGAFSKVQFERINGYSNLFWGWGGEDDDAYTRVRAAGYSLMRSSANIGRYVMLTKNHVRAQPGPDRDKLLKTSARRMFRDGLNTVHYKILEKTEYPLYTHFMVQLPKEPYMISTTSSPTVSSSTPGKQKGS